MNRHRGPSDPAATGVASSLDRYLDLLAVSRRRHALRALRERNPPVPMTDLARRIAEAEPTRDPADDDRADAVRISLHHRHVPKLADAGVLEHDPDRNAVEPAHNFDDALAVLEALTDVDGTTATSEES